MAESATAPKQEPTGIELCFCKLFLHEQDNVMIVKVKRRDQKFSFLLGGKKTPVRVWFDCSFIFQCVLQLRIQSFQKQMNNLLLTTVRSSKSISYDQEP